MEKKTKKFIFTVPLQEHLNLSTYKSDNLLYRYGETRYPIIPVINGVTDSEDEIEIVAIMLTNDDDEGSEHPWVANNYGLFLDELKTLRDKGKFKSYSITQIKSKNDSSIREQISLLKELISNINNNEDLYACITYGTKPTPMVLLDALNYGYKIKENTAVKSVVYGWYNFRNPDDNKLFDETALFYANSQINRLADLKAPNVDEQLNQFLDF